MRKRIINRSVELVEIARRHYEFKQASDHFAWVKLRQSVHFNILTEEMAAWCKEKNVKPNTISTFVHRTFTALWNMNSYEFTSFDQLRDLEPKIPRTRRSHSIVNEGKLTDTRGIKQVIRKNWNG